MSRTMDDLGRALADHERAYYTGDPRGWEDKAAAVVRAMREPTQEMLDAAVASTLAFVTEFVGADHPDLAFIDRAEAETHARRLHHAMMDAILNPD